MHKERKKRDQKTKFAGCNRQKLLIENLNKFRQKWKN